jgi:multidrug efflux pump subunit AcrA (membrane-fusion protein)
MSLASVVTIGLSVIAAGPPWAGPWASRDEAAAPDQRVVRVASRIDGVFAALATEPADGVEPPPGRSVTLKSRGQERTLRVLKAGDRVAKGQVVAVLEDALARGQREVAEGQVKIAEAEEKLAEMAWMVAYDDRIRQERRHMPAMGRGYQDDEWAYRNLLVRQKRTEWECKKEALKLARVKAANARTFLELHTIRSPVAGVIRRAPVQPGEAVKQFETVVAVEAEGD